MQAKSKIKKIGLAIGLLIAGLTILPLAGNCESGSEMEKQTPKTEKASSDKAKEKTVLVSKLAGSWYPAGESALRSQLDDFAQNAAGELKENVIGLILPHAGYQFSGKAAMAAIKSLGNKQYQRVIVIGPSHRSAMMNILSVPGATHYQTPLGEIPLDTAFISRLKQHDIFQTIPPVHENEHSVQIEVPLLQYALKDFQLVPIVAGQLDLETIKKAAAILNSMVDEQTVVVASSDFTHYGPNFDYTPFKENVSEKLKELDMGAYEFIAHRDMEGFYNYRQAKGATICGYIPISILAAMLPADSEVSLAQYDTSGNITGDYTNSVSYLSAVITGHWQKTAAPASQPQQAELSEADKEQLLKLARQSIVYYLENQRLIPLEKLETAISEAMKQTRATFVTLEAHHSLRGCIGEIYPSQPLYLSVLVNAVKSAVSDPRFPPVRKDECPQLKLEISVLTPPREVPGYKDIVIGRHGVILSKAGRSAVFLPQVAPEQGWDVEETLRHLSMKAGLPKDAWKEGAQFMVFEAIVFSEKEQQEQEEQKEP